MADAHPSPAPASAWIARFCAGVPAGSRVLDFAAGAGRHAGLLAGRAVHYVAVDHDAEALARAEARHGEAFRGAGGTMTCLRVDLERGAWPMARGGFDLVIVSNFLHRPRLALLCDLIAPGGRLIHETFADGQQAFGRPRREAFLLRAGELLDVCRRAGLHVLAYEDGLSGGGAASGRGTPLARRQRVCALRPPVAWWESDAPDGLGDPTHGLG